MFFLKVVGENGTSDTVASTNSFVRKCTARKRKQVNLWLKTQCCPWLAALGSIFKTSDTVGTSQQEKKNPYLRLYKLKEPFIK